MKTRTVDPSFAPNYLKRAEECLNSAKEGTEKERWNACVISAIHSAISSADAYCVFKLGLRSAGQTHSDSIALFASINSESEFVKNGIKHLSSLLKIKTDAEYSERLQNRSDAESSIKHAERLLSFVKGEVARK